MNERGRGGTLATPEQVHLKPGHVRCHLHTAPLATLGGPDSHFHKLLKSKCVNL